MSARFRGDDVHRHQPRADQLGNPAALTNGYQAAFIGAAGVTVAATLAALALLSTRSATASPEDTAAETDASVESEQEAVTA